MDNPGINPGSAALFAGLVDTQQINVSPAPKTFLEQRLERIQAQKDEPPATTEEQVTALTEIHEALEEKSADNRLQEILKKQKEEQEKKFAVYRYDAPMPRPEIFDSPDVRCGLYKMLCMPINIKVGSESGLISMTNDEIEQQFWQQPLVRIIKRGPCVYRGHRMRDLGITDETMEELTPQVGDYLVLNPKAPGKWQFSEIRFVMINDEDYHMHIKPSKIKEFLGIKEDVPGDSAAVREYEQPELPLPLKQLTEEAA